MNKEELEEFERQLRKSEMDYSLKANLYLRGIAFTPCPDCHFKNESPPASFLVKTENCFERCQHKLMVWIMSENQSQIYEKLRSPDKKREELEKAINERKLIAVVANMRG